MVDGLKISDALILAAASALSYSVAFAYQTGFSEFFDLPPIATVPTVSTILQAAGAVFILFVNLFPFVDTYWKLSPRGDTALQRAVAHRIRMSFAWGLFFFLAMQRLMALEVFLVVTLVGSFFDFIFPLIIYNKDEGYEAKLLAREADKTGAFSKSLSGKTVAVVGQKNILWLSAAIMLVMIAYLLGWAVAREKQDYVIIDNRPGFVVAWMNESNMIIVQYDKATLKLTGKYEVLPLINPQPNFLETRHIGRLLK